MGAVKRDNQTPMNPLAPVPPEHDATTVSETKANDKEQIYLASQWQLIWRRFRRHRLAMVSIVILLVVYLVAAFAEFVAPYDPYRHDRRYAFVPPQMPRFISEDGFQLRPFVHGIQQSRDPVTLQVVYELDTTQRYPLYLFVRGTPYKFWGLWDGDLRLFGTEEGTVFLLGADHLGRCLFSRIIYGARISTTIGLMGVLLSFLIGIPVGAVSGYYGGALDELVQRLIEFLQSIPSIPLWMGLAASLPADWPVIRVYFGITVILSLIGWGGLARVVRSKFMSLREEDFIMSARLIGASEWRVILLHMLPSFSSHIIASITLAVPGMILAETSLSFLGLGIRPPAISWGSLLQQAQNVRSVALAPWLLTPALFVIVTVLAFNFLGDGLRDAADPYSER